MAIMLQSALESARSCSAEDASHAATGHIKRERIAAVAKRCTIEEMHLFKCCAGLKHFRVAREVNCRAFRDDPENHKGKLIQLQNKRAHTSIKQGKSLPYSDSFCSKTGRYSPTNCDTSVSKCKCHKVPSVCKGHLIYK